jgi:hypothetical protein
MKCRLHCNLTLDRVIVKRNSVAGSAGEVASGGGVYTRDPITRSATVIKRNNPDQCFGCSTAAAATRNARAKSATQPRRTTSNMSDYIGAASGGSRK